MNTTFVGTKELRQNMARITKDAHKKNKRIIVFRKNQPLFALVPLSSDDALVEILAKDIAEARKEKKAGKVKTQAEVEKMLGI